MPLTSLEGPECARPVSVTCDTAHSTDPECAGGNAGLAVWLVVSSVPSPHAHVSRVCQDGKTLRDGRGLPRTNIDLPPPALSPSTDGVEHAVAQCRRCMPAAGGKAHEQAE